ncbi:MAG TPA: DegQ family serine endoprotease [Candidatus Acidoferrales bacterium]|nr:DegQ family serine endoprotease [Candidatus Acidoferrales bacterium]
MQKDAIRSRWTFVIAVVLGGVVAGGVLGSWAARNGYPPFTTRGLLGPALANNAAPSSPITPLPYSFAPVIQPALPGVVYISTTKVVQRRNMWTPFFNDPLFQQFFGNQNPGSAVPEKEYALGSGVIVRPDGLILTNNHVVAGADDVRVTLSDKRQLKAKVLGTDPQTDLAVLKIDANGLTALPLGDSTQIRVGDIVFAIGDPFGVGETVTMGIISAKGRNDLNIEGPSSYTDFIQTDAAINPGNSGGALLDTRGQVIGINTAILTSGDGRGGNVGIGFAVPVDLARNVMNQIVEHGKVTRGHLGVYIQTVTPELAKKFGLPAPEGALVASVEAGSPAAKAGIEQGDIILKFNGEPLTNMQDLSLKVAQAGPSATVHLEVFRNGTTRQVAVVLGEATAANSALPGQSTPQGSAMTGVKVQALTPELAQQLSLPANTRGVVIAAVDPSSPAAGTLQRGDVIQQVNRKPVSNPVEFDQAVQQAGSSPILLLVNRGGQTIYVVISPSGGQ